jgi:hypothetical protein
MWAAAVDNLNFSLQNKGLRVIFVMKTLWIMCDYLELLRVCKQVFNSFPTGFSMWKTMIFVRLKLWVN